MPKGGKKSFVPLKMKEITAEDKYEWTQTPSTITAACWVGDSVKSQDSVKISMGDGKLNVTIDGQSEPILSGVLYGQVNHETGMWLFLDNLLIVHFKKFKKGIWNGFLHGGKTQVSGKHASLANVEFHLGRTYDEGLHDIKKDSDMALICYANAAELGSLAAQLHLAMMYLLGKPRFSVDVDAKAALKYHMMAVEDHNHVEGLYHVGAAYQAGEIVEKNFKKSLEYFQRAATKMPAKDATDDASVLEAQQAVMAMFNIGLLYNTGGSGVPQDFEKAAYWWKEAARYNSPQAMYNLGVLCLNGTGMPQDAIIAFTLFWKAQKFSPELTIPEQLAPLQQQLVEAAAQMGMQFEQFMEQMHLEYQKAEAQGITARPQEVDILTPRYNSARASPILREKMNPEGETDSKKKRRRKGKSKEQAADSGNESEPDVPMTITQRFNTLPVSWRYAGAAAAAVFVTSLLYKLVVRK